MGEITKSYLETVVAQKAQKRVDADLRNLKEVIANNPIGAQLGIKVGEKPGAGGMVGKFLPISNTNSTWCLLAGAKEGFETNLEAIEVELLEKYKKQELDSILEKLSGLEYLFEAQQ